MEDGWGVLYSHVESINLRYLGALVLLRARCEGWVDSYVHLTAACDSMTLPGRRSFISYRQPSGILCNIST